MSLRVDSFPNFAEFWLAVCEMDDSESLALVQTFVYAIWEARNRVVFQQGETSVALVLRRVADLHGHVREPMEGQRMRQAQLKATWCRPARGIIKCNFDASFRDGGIAGLGMVARNCDGEVMASACSSPVSISSPLLAEALGLRWTMQLATDLGFRRITLETNCLQLFNTWRSQEEGRSYLSSIISDCRILISAFDYVSVSFVRRTGNTVADFLARNSDTYANMVWVEEVPLTVVSLIDADVMNSLPSGF
ncbi:uncharacterized protein LOC130744783 [Lotus japonicus]|uniref:uncharacterized protein LOC130744783 n=1 Tax=Lotus japonicus TaxID=34305 RepID=UPI00258BC413|nr:uncharacterized protein LOC130744783 [Lotus japonicus]